MVAQVGKQMSHLSAQVAQNSNADQAHTEMLNMHIASLNAAQEKMEDDIKELTMQEGNKAEATKIQQQTQMALQFRGAYKKVEDNTAVQKERSAKMKATQILMAQID